MIFFRMSFFIYLCYLSYKIQTGEIPVRLADGNRPYEGRVEVFYQGVWGTICNHYWDRADSEVVCRQLGYSLPVHGTDSVHFGRGSGPIVLDRVSCDGHEASIDQCDHGGWFASQFCSHGNDIGVLCQPGR